MLRRAGPLRVRIEAEGPEASELLARASAEGLVLVPPGAEAELVARPEGPSLRPAELVARSARPSLPQDETRGQGRPASALSPRELEILDYLVDGWSNADIAAALRIGVRTVRFHLGNIYGRLGVSRRGEAVREAVRLGLVRFEV